MARQILQQCLDCQAWTLSTTCPKCGGTAQAEFELLTGIRAFSRINSIEFNVMKGHKTHSFIDKLKETGYQTMATIGTGAGFFNSIQAYQSLSKRAQAYASVDKRLQASASVCQRLPALASVCKRLQASASYANATLLHGLGTFFKHCFLFIY